MNGSRKVDGRRLDPEVMGAQKNINRLLRLGVLRQSRPLDEKLPIGLTFNHEET